MRIFFAFLVVLASTLLWLLPITEGTYDFQTDLRDDIFTVETGVGVTTANVTLLKPIYDDDTSTIELLSDNSLDEPLFSSYNSTTRALEISGLSGNITRTMTVTYDIDALSGSDALNNVVENVKWIWLLIIIAFPGAALVYIFTHRA